MSKFKTSKLQLAQPNPLPGYRLATPMLLLLCNCECIHFLSYTRTQYMHQQMYNRTLYISVPYSARNCVAKYPLPNTPLPNNTPPLFRKAFFNLPFCKRVITLPYCTAKLVLVTLCSGSCSFTHMEMYRAV